MILSGAPVFTPNFIPGRFIPAPALTQKVRSEVIFGTPSKNCSGNGICMLTQHRSTRSVVCPCPKVLCWVQINPVNREVLLEFDRNTLSDEVQQKFLAHHLFLMEESIKMPFFIKKIWKISGRVFLNSGHYPIIKQEDKITLILYYTQMNNN